MKNYLISFGLCIACTVLSSMDGDIERLKFLLKCDFNVAIFLWIAYQFRNLK